MRRSSLAVFLALLLPALAHADDARERAIQAARRATTLYKAGKHAEAAALFLEAHRLTGLAVQLRNAAKATEASGDEARAIELWSALIELPAASDDDRAEAREHLARLRPAPLVAPPPPPPPIAVEPAPRERAPTAELTAEGPPPARAEWPAFVLMGGGGALAAGGVILWVASASALGELDDRLAVTEGGLITGIDPAQAQRDLDEVNQQRVLGSVLIGAGLAAVAGGIWWAVGP